MTQFLENVLDTDPFCVFAHLFTAVTGHIIGHRTNWGLYIKNTLEINPI